jgi:nitric oxide reductase subunit B
VISPERAKVQAELADYYAKIFMNAPEMAKLRDQYAIPKNTVKTPERMAKMNAFFSWAAWVCITDRPGDDVTYTNNWPHDELIGNVPPSLHLGPVSVC